MTASFVKNDHVFSLHSPANGYTACDSIRGGRNCCDYCDCCDCVFTGTEQKQAECLVSSGVPFFGITDIWNQITKL